jgi:hypothetical protein
VLGLRLPAGFTVRQKLGRVPLDYNLVCRLISAREHRAAESGIEWADPLRDSLAGLMQLDRRSFSCTTIISH